MLEHVIEKKADAAVVLCSDMSAEEQVEHFSQLNHYNFPLVAYSLGTQQKQLKKVEEILVMESVIGMKLTIDVRQAEAKEYFERYLKETPNDSSTHFYLAVAFDEQGDNEKAIFHYKKALELNPRAENAYNNLALAYIKIKDYRNAYGVLMKAVKLGHPKKKDMAELAKQIKEKIDGKISYSFSVNP